MLKEHGRKLRSSEKTQTLKRRPRNKAAPEYYW
jgi:hypothetical protein